MTKKKAKQSKDSVLPSSKTEEAAHFKRKENSMALPGVYHSQLIIPLTPPGDPAQAIHDLGTLQAQEDDGWLRVDHYEDFNGVNHYIITVRYLIVNHSSLPISIDLGEDTNVESAVCDWPEGEWLFPGEEALVKLSVKPKGEDGISWSIDVELADDHGIRKWTTRGKTP